VSDLFSGVRRAHILIEKGYESRVLCFSLLFLVERNRKWLPEKRREGTKRIKKRKKGYVMKIRNKEFPVEFQRTLPLIYGLHARATYMGV
jgi:hypothetical protein